MGFHRLPHGTVTATRARWRIWRAGILLGLVMIVPISNVPAAAKRISLTRLPGYKPVPVRYAPLNKMIMSVRVNGQPANLLVDTGSNQVILDADAAESFSVRPSQRGLRYIRFTRINGQSLPVGFAQSLRAGTMSFGSVLVTLRDSSYPHAGNADVDGVLGLDILTRYKAVINCRTKFVFFKVDQSRQTDLVSAASAEGFTRISLRREDNGALTVPCSIHGRSARMLVDTGAFITTFHQPFLKSLGIPLEPTQVSAHFARGTTRKISAGKINDLTLGRFKIPAAKFGATGLPNFTLRQGDASVGGILGMDTLYNYHAIIDLDGMNLFLK
jgi:predicted aspartyl protease